MPSELLSDVLIRSLPAREKQYDVWDTKLPAFGIRVSPGGAKTFVLNQDKARRSIGRYGVISLSEARTEAKRQIAEKTLGRIRPQSITYEQAVKVFLEEKGERRKARTVADHKRHLNKLGFKCQLAEVKHQDMERKLKRLPPSEFNHRLACAKTFFTWAQKKRYITDNPTVGLSPHKRPSRKRILTDVELGIV
jgi:Arm DNA-binding domain